jgi:NTE family protein
LLCLSTALVACATRPVNPPIAPAALGGGYRLDTRPDSDGDQDNVLILAFSGGGTRAAAFSYGTLEFLRNTQFVSAKGKTGRLIDAVSVITGVSGGSFTALAYGLYGDRLFDDYEERFLKRNVQGELIARAATPTNWASLLSGTWGRSELASDLYDDILFGNATFADLQRAPGPMIQVSATDLSTGTRFSFNQVVFDILCSDLGQVKLSRAAAASSAVPVVLSPITLRNHGGTCGWTPPAWTDRFLNGSTPPRPAARAIRTMRALYAFGDGAVRPYLHLVDGGVSDNVGMRAVLDTLEVAEALHFAGEPTPIGKSKRIAVFVVNSLSSPPTPWDQSDTPPGAVDIMLKSAGVPIDHFSYESIELLRDISSRWHVMNEIRATAHGAVRGNQAIATATQVPTAEIYAIDVSFAALKGDPEFEYLNSLPTSFSLPDEAVDRLRAAAGRIIMASPDFQRLLKDVGITIMPKPARRAR